MTAKRVGIEHLRRAEKDCSGAASRSLGNRPITLDVGIGSARILPGSKIPRRFTHPTLGARDGKLRNHHPAPALLFGL